MPTITAWSYRHSVVSPYIYPDNEPELYRELHEHAVENGRSPSTLPTHTLPGRSTCLPSPWADPRAELQHTNAMRAVGSSQADPYLAISAARRRLVRPAARSCKRAGHQDAQVIGSADNVPGYLRKAKEGKVRCRDLATSVYENRDPARGDHEAHRRAGIRGYGTGIQVSMLPSNWKELRLRISTFVERKTVSQTSTTIPESSYQAMGFEPEFLPCSLPFRAASAGWPSGTRCSGTRSRN